MTSRTVTGPALLLAATALAGGCGYLVGIIVPGSVGVVDYAVFAVVWSTLYFLVGAFGGLQQEFARASTPRSLPSETAEWAPGGAGRALLVAIVTALGALLVVGATSERWAPLIAPGDAALGVGWAVAVGVSGYIGVAVCCGLLYGLSAWRTLAVLIAVDGVLRLAAVALAIALHADATGLAWAVVLPFPAALLLVLPVVARRLRRETVLGASVRELGWNGVRAVVAAAATAALVSGIPLLLRLALPDIDARILAPLLLALTLTRAPLVIPVLALQSYLIVRFRTSGGAGMRRIALAVAAAGVLVAVLAAIVGPWLLVAVFGPEFAVEPLTLGLLVASSGTLGALCVTAAALIARDRHGANTVGWVVAIVATLLPLALPVDVPLRVGIALLVGSATGFVSHLLMLSASPQARPIDAEVAA